MRRPASPAVLAVAAAALAVAGILLVRGPTLQTTSPTAPTPRQPSSSSSATQPPASITTSSLSAPPPPPPPGPTSSAPTTSTSWEDDVHPPGSPAPSSGIPATPAGTLEQHAAVAAAQTFMTAFARPAAGTDPRAWWAKVAPLMTPQGRLDYQGVDPARVPYTRLTGPGMIQPQAVEPDHHLQTLVRVPTDAGDHVVALQHREQGWFVTRITPTRGVS